LGRGKVVNTDCAKVRGKKQRTGKAVLKKNCVQKLGGEVMGPLDRLGCKGTQEESTKSTMLATSGSKEKQKKLKGGGGRTDRAGVPRTGMKYSAPKKKSLGKKAKKEGDLTPGECSQKKKKIKHLKKRTGITWPYPAYEFT